MSTFRLSWVPSPPAVLAYGVAIAAVTGALVITLLLDRYLQSMPTALLLLCTIMFAAWFGGFGPGFVATALAAVFFLYFLIKPGDPFDLQARDLPRFALFILAAFFVILLCAVQRRTARELARVNQALLAENDERRRIEAYLEEAQALSRTGCFGWKTDTGGIFLSKEGYRVLDIHPDEKPLISVLAQQRVHPDDRSLLMAELDRVSRGERDYDVELRWLTTDGEARHLHIRAHRMVAETGQHEVVGAVMDISETRYAQETLQATQAALAHAARVATLGEISASIAHEVNQPLAGIVTNGEAGLRWLDRKEPQLDEVRNAMERMIRDAKRASEVVRHLRALARKGPAERHPVDLNELIEESIYLLQREIQRRRIVMRTNLSPNLPRVMANRIELQQVVINLMVNGMQAMDSVSERPRHLVVRSSVDGGVATVAIEDSGIGLDGAIEPRLFSPFFTTREDGMGIGLSICRTIIDSHGGRIWASSNQGPGATFRFTLPLSPSVP
jgi:C4-dicarboxylate-specific signal transduction histidine kinase